MRSAWGSRRRRSSEEGGRSPRRSHGESVRVDSAQRKPSCVVVRHHSNRRTATSRRCQLLSSAVTTTSPADGEACTMRSEEHTSELQSLMRISYAVFCLKKKTKQTQQII